MNCTFWGGKGECQCWDGGVREVRVARTYQRFVAGEEKVVCKPYSTSQGDLF